MLNISNNNNSNSFLPPLPQYTIPPSNTPPLQQFSSSAVFLPNIKDNVWDSLNTLKIQKRNKMQKKKTEELVFKALEKQTEMLAEISRKFKKESEEDEARLMKKIKELERENNEILWQRRNEDMIQQRVVEKLRNLHEINAYNFQFNPFYSFLNPLNVPKESDSSSDESEKPKKKSKKSKKKPTKSKKTVKNDEKVEKIWEI